MSDIVLEMLEEKNFQAAKQAIITIDESIARLKHNRQILCHTRDMYMGLKTSEVDNVVDTIKNEVDIMCAKIPIDLDDDEACEWLRYALIDVIYSNT